MRVTLYGFVEMNYVSARIEAIEVETDDEVAEFDPDTGELLSPNLGGWYYRTFGQAKKEALRQLRREIEELRYTVQAVSKLKKPT